MGVEGRGPMPEGCGKGKNQKDLIVYMVEGERMKR